MSPATSPGHHISNHSSVAPAVICTQAPSGTVPLHVDASEHGTDLVTTPPESSALWESRSPKSAETFPYTSMTLRAV